MKHMDILIIDDEKKFADMLSRRLGLRGIHCEICYDGVSGLERIKKEHRSVSLILLDLNLPDIYGIQVMAQIKKINPELPIIVVTGHGSAYDEKKCMELGGHGFINKPIRIETIMQMLNEIKKGD